VYRDIILAGILRHGIAVLAGEALLCALPWCIRKSIAYDDDGDETLAAVFGIASLIGLLAGAPMLAVNIGSFLTAWFAPRAYLIDYLR
jgi:hypothetical protein